MDNKLIEEMNNIWWWHSIDLGNGVVTPGRHNTKRKLDRLYLPEDMTGLSVLDIGAWDGFFSFECEKRGAKRVVALDDPKWSWRPNDKIRTGKKGFEFARRILCSSVEDVDLSVDDISAKVLGKFDLVLFLGVFYHVKNPYDILRNCYSITLGTLIVETIMSKYNGEIPILEFEQEARKNNMPTYFSPNESCIVSMLEDVGFSRVVAFPGNRRSFHAYV